MFYRVKWFFNYYKNFLLELFSSNLRVLIDKLLCIYKVNNCLFIFIYSIFYFFVFLEILLVSYRNYLFLRNFYCDDYR